MNVEVTQFNNFIFVKPACLSVLSDSLTYLHSSFEFSFKDKKRVMTKTPVTIYSYDDEKDTLSVPAGCKDRVIKKLKAYGYNVSYKNVLKVPKERRQLDLSNIDLKQLRPEQLQVIEAIIGNTHTTGKAATGAGKSFMISYICRMYPKANICITTDAVDVVKTLRSYLERDCGEKVGQVGGGKNNEYRITIATLKSLNKLKTKPDILIVDECHVIGSDSYSSACLVAAKDAFKVIGLSASPHGRADNAFLIIESICGPVRADIPYQVSVNNGSVAQIVVDVYSCTDGPDQSLISLETIQAEKDRLAIWSNNARNKLIRSIVNKELSSDPEQQILIYTERTEHAIYLYNILQDLDFHIVCGNVKKESKEIWKKKGILPDESILDCDREQYRQDFSSCKVKRVICTRVWQKGVDFPKLAILLRADGMASEITSDQSSGRLSRTDGGNKVQAKVIDIDDEFSDTYHRRFKEREAVYNNHGWIVKRCRV